MQPPPTTSAGTSANAAAAGMSSMNAGSAVAGTAAPMAGTSAAMAGTTAMPEPMIKATKLSLEFTTKPYGGKWGPVNVGAVWVADAGGKWVYSLELWCGWQNIRHLAPYNTAGGQDYSVGLLPGTYLGVMPPTDVVSSATLKNHKTHKGAVWTFKDSKGKEVPDGMYKLMFELTEQEDAGKTLEVPFMKGAAPGPVVATGSTVFTDVHITLQ